MSSNTKTTLNPNAIEFIPTALRSSSSVAAASTTEESKVFPVEKCGKAVLDRTNSSNSNASDEERRRYWDGHLPDDIITSDFSFLGQDPVERFESAEYVTRASGFQHIERIPDTSVRAVTGRSPWEHHHAVSSGHLLSSGNQDGQLLNDYSGIDFSNELFGECYFPEELGDIDPVNLRANEFPGLAVQSLADIYHANGGDFRLPFEIPTQLQLQEDGGPPRHIQSRPSSSPNLKSIDFPALSRPQLVNGLSQFLEDVDMHDARMQNVVEADSFLRNRSGALGHPTAITDFTAVTRKNASQWQIERNGALDFTQGSTRFLSPNLGLGSVPGDSRATDGERFERFSLTHRSHQLPSQTWLETGDAVASICSELREEARNPARVRNAYFGQARQTYLDGNKDLAKEASAKGQLHNRLMKATHSKAGEAIRQQRNLFTTQIQNLGQGQSHVLDLHGLYVNEAIPRLKWALSSLRVAARSTRQEHQVFICVGTGHHTKGSRTPAILPCAVERYLREEELLPFTEPKPGIIKVVLS